MIYRALRPLLFSLPAEFSHTAMHALGAKMSKRSWLTSTMHRVLHTKHPALSTTLGNLKLSNPVGLAAGFDKPGELIDLCYGLDFGFVEVGTVTPRAQPGNPQPRLFRLTKDQAIINRMGFNNDGIEVFVENIRRRRSTIVVGANIGKNKDTPLERASADYVLCASAVLPYVDYIAINVSSPNTPHLRMLQDKGPLREIIFAVQDQRAKQQRMTLPIFLKISPDLTTEALDDVIEVLLETQCDGVIATNTTIARSRLNTSEQRLASIGEGGLSGVPLRSASTAVIRHIYTATQGKIPIIGVGGIFSAADAYEKIRAGASLVQLYTGLVYRGPLLAHTIHRELPRFLERDGFSSITQAVGADLR